jgi:hypothetical protein
MKRRRGVWAWGETAPLAVSMALSLAICALLLWPLAFRLLSGRLAVVAALALLFVCDLVCLVAYYGVAAWLSERRGRPGGRGMV